MALISTKNIISPFTNKLHLTTIILLVIAFTILRLSGGRVYVKEGGKQGFSIDNLQDTPVRKDTSQNESPTKNSNSSLKELEEMFR